MGRVGINLCGELQEQAELTYLNRFLHNIDAKEVIQNRTLQCEIARVGVRADLRQRCLEILEFFRCMPFGGTFKIADEGLHPVEAGLIKRFEDIEGCEQKRAGTASGVENRHAHDRLPERSQEVRTFASFNPAMTKLANIQIEG